jgi:small subunit ribosomal protein S7
MSRRTRAVKRPIVPDPVYGSGTVTKFINALMYDGKKSLAERIFYDAMQLVEQRAGQPADAVFQQALSNAKPVLEVKSRRVGGATYQVPVEVPARRARTLGVRWLVEFARQRREKTMAQRLANELLDAQNQQGGAYKRKDDIYRMAQANKAFAHYRW